MQNSVLPVVRFTEDELLVDAYALVCEAAKRKLGLQPYEVQKMAAIALHERFLIEQQTGEGKTLSAVMPAYLTSHRCLLQQTPISQRGPAIENWSPL